MTKTERLIDYMNSMDNNDLVHTIVDMCYQYNLYTDNWMSMEDFDEVMKDVEPSCTVKLVLDAGRDFDMTDEYFITDKMDYMYSGDVDMTAKWIRNDIPEYARIIIDYGIEDTLDAGLNSIIERGDN